MFCARDGHQELVELLLSEEYDTEIELAAHNGITALMCAADAGHLKIVERLIEKGADVNTATKAGDTALLQACQSGHTEVVRILLEAHADVNVIGKQLCPPSLIAARNGWYEILSMIISYGADISAQDEDGRTICDFELEGEIGAAIQRGVTERFNRYFKQSTSIMPIIPRSFGMSHHPARRPATLDEANSNGSSSHPVSSASSSPSINSNRHPNNSRKSSHHGSISTVSDSPSTHSPIARSRSPSLSPSLSHIPVRPRKGSHLLPPTSSPSRYHHNRSHPSPSSSSSSVTSSSFNPTHTRSTSHRNSTFQSTPLPLPLTDAALAELEANVESIRTRTIDSDPSVSPTLSIVGQASSSNSMIQSIVKSSRLNTSAPQLLPVQSNVRVMMTASVGADDDDDDDSDDTPAIEPAMSSNTLYMPPQRASDNVHLFDESENDPSSSINKDDRLAESDDDDDDDDDDASSDGYDSSSHTLHLPSHSRRSSLSSSPAIPLTSESANEVRLSQSSSPIIHSSQQSQLAPPNLALHQSDSIIEANDSIVRPADLVSSSSPPSPSLAPITSIDSTAASISIDSSSTLPNHVSSPTSTTDLSPTTALRSAIIDAVESQQSPLDYKPILEESTDSVSSVLTSSPPTLAEIVAQVESAAAAASETGSYDTDDLDNTVNPPLTSSGSVSILPSPSSSPAATTSVSSTVVSAFNLDPAQLSSSASSTTPTRSMAKRRARKSKAVAEISAAPEVPLAPQVIKMFGSMPPKASTYGLGTTTPAVAPILSSAPVSVPIPVPASVSVSAPAPVSIPAPLDARRAAERLVDEWLNFVGFDAIARSALRGFTFPELFALDVNDCIELVDDRNGPMLYAMLKKKKANDALLPATHTDLPPNTSSSPVDSTSSSPDGSHHLAPSVDWAQAAIEGMMQADEEDSTSRPTRPNQHLSALSPPSSTASSSPSPLPPSRTDGELIAPTPIQSVPSASTILSSSSGRLPVMATLNAPKVVSPIPIAPPVKKAPSIRQQQQSSQQSPSTASTPSISLVRNSASSLSAVSSVIAGRLSQVLSPASASSNPSQTSKQPPSNPSSPSSSSSSTSSVSAPTSDPNRYYSRSAMASSTTVTDAPTGYWTRDASAATAAWFSASLATAADIWKAKVEGRNLREEMRAAQPHRIRRQQQHQQQLVQQTQQPALQPPTQQFARRSMTGV